MHETIKDAVVSAIQEASQPPPPHLKLDHLKSALEGIDAKSAEPIGKLEGEYWAIDDELLDILFLQDGLLLIRDKAPFPDFKANARVIRLLNTGDDGLVIPCYLDLSKTSGDEEVQESLRERVQELVGQTEYVWSGYGFLVRPGDIIGLDEVTVFD